MGACTEEGAWEDLVVSVAVLAEAVEEEILVEVALVVLVVEVSGAAAPQEDGNGRI